MEIYDRVRKSERDEDEKNGNSSGDHANEALEVLEGELKQLKEKVSDISLQCRDNKDMVADLRRQILQMKGSAESLKEQLKKKKKEEVHLFTSLEETAKTAAKVAVEEGKKIAEVEQPKVAEKESELSDEAMKALLGKKFADYTTLSEFLDGFQKQSEKCT